MKSSHIETGKVGEREGIAYLKKLGYKILETNYKTPIGEIDCIAKFKNQLIFVEIKTRTSTIYGLPEEAVGYQKQAKIAKVSHFYLKEKGLIDKIAVRFDVLSVVRSLENGFTLNHIENAFEIESKENT